MGHCQLNRFHVILSCNIFPSSAPKRAPPHQPELGGRSREAVFTGSWLASFTRHRLCLSKVSQVCMPSANHICVVWLYPLPVLPWAFRIPTASKSKPKKKGIKVIYASHIVHVQYLDLGINYTWSKKYIRSHDIKLSCVVSSRVTQRNVNVESLLKCTPSPLNSGLSVIRDPTTGMLLDFTEVLSHNC